MKKTLLLLSLLISFGSFAQDSVLLNNTWYLYTLSIDDVIYQSPIPVSDTQLGITQEWFELNHVQCTETFSAPVEFTDFSGFVVGSGVTLLGFGCSPQATQWYNRHYSFYKLMDDQPDTFTYFFEVSDGDEIGLAVLNPDGDYAFYGNTALGTPNFNTSRVTLYPNPASDVLKFSGLDQAEISGVQVYDGVGHKVLSASEVEDEINVSNLAGGIYFINIILKSGGEVTKKFVKI